MDCGSGGGGQQQSYEQTSSARVYTLGGFVLCHRTTSSQSRIRASTTSPVKIRPYMHMDSIWWYMPIYTMSEYTLYIHIYQYIYLQDLYPQFKTTHPTCIYPEKLDLVLSLYVCCAAALLGSEFCIWTGWRLNIYI